MYTVMRVQYFQTFVLKIKRIQFLHDMLLSYQCKTQQILKSLFLLYYFF